MLRFWNGGIQWSYIVLDYALVQAGMGDGGAGTVLCVRLR